ncbi:DegT/DnrJ/EryC1/StrS family aminotransferase [Pseudomonas cichorii]|uniref:dTDP-4-dehydro-6-deoxyglucose aminotransferase n=1 Tax=Pseudomonas cichorii TaxID=36746 RepID=A0ABQ1DKN9_PSECI|nr:DegT/DnrJ/EryC1/StrS family aminotransferase [Pseudomonas cichorii]AHF66776.1 bifunctional enzyme including aminotransferase and chitin synthase [Pseudomonas cichorii JBC1]QVE18677.1 DegT/DnrJ/EryC1/StrS family aminotransferase [Pseudomonas cichorii]SDO03975.1 dTDP-4-amino-4,6-dideoxygalactose transaminase [Pseudomonas cichorii]GFM74370.1 dTDP-4-dehydro-6-deoxyglucose aminotransferase [Pseudomonas cichorii]GFM91576.1 dTDP-4-dehydro-6-deoxyglucose aminotransferase [Pseudomonas cichorii]
MNPHTLKPETDKRLGIVRPTFAPFEILAPRFKSSMDSGVVTNGGPQLKTFEARLSDYLSVPTLAFCNGEQALIALLMAADLKGKEVIVPSFTFVGSVHAIVIAGAIPVFAEIQSLDCPLADLSDIERKITENTGAILAVDVYGYANDYKSLEKLAKQNGLRLFIDSAPAFGSLYQGQRIGGFGDGQIFSFHATKPFNTLEGGCVCTNDTELMSRVAAIRNFGQSDQGECLYVGLNGKMSEINAIVGLAQLPSLELQLKCRRQAAARLIQGLEGIPGLNVCQPTGEQEPVWQYLPVRVDPEHYGMNRDELQHTMATANVMVRKYYSPACHLMPAYASPQQTDLKLTEELACSVLALPIYNDMSEAECDRIVALLYTLYLSGLPVVAHQGVAS